MTRLGVVRWSVEAREAVNWARLPEGTLTATFVASRPSPLYPGPSPVKVRRVVCPGEQLAGTGPGRVVVRLLARWTDPTAMYGLGHALRDVDVVNALETYARPAAQAIDIARRRRIPVTVTCYENVPFHFDAERSTAATKDKVRAEADRFIAVGPSVVEALLAEGVEAGRISMIPFGVDLDRFTGPCQVGDTERSAEHARLGRLDGEVAFLYAGRFLREKGLVQLVMAAAAARREGAPVRLVLVGRGPELPRLEIAARARRFEALTIVPWLDPSLVPGTLAAADVVVQPSLPTPYWTEQLGYSIIEAMAARRPVLGTATGSIPWVVGDGGIVVPPYDVDALAEAMIRLARSVELRRTLGAAARARAEAVFDARLIGRQLAELHLALGRA